MKIVTWNVNGLRAVERKGALQDLIENYNPDILLLQEIKGKEEQFSDFLTKNDDFTQFYHSAEKPGYAGTGVWMKKNFVQDENIKNITFNTCVPKAPNADEGRVSHISFSQDEKIFDILSIYFPNGGKSEEVWKEKLVFFDRVLEYMNFLRADGHEVIVGGDMNVAHNEIDLSRPKENDGNIGFHLKERVWMDNVMKNNWVDVFRARYPDATEIYSWWAMTTRARERNVGWRLDYFFIDKEFLNNISEIQYLNEQMGSDHCPLLMRLA